MRSWVHGLWKNAPENWEVYFVIRYPYRRPNTLWGGNWTPKPISKRPSQRIWRRNITAANWMIPGGSSFWRPIPWATRTHGLPPAAWPGRKRSAFRTQFEVTPSCVVPRPKQLKEEYECIRQNLWELWQMYDIQWQRHVFFKYALFVYWMLGRYLWGSHISKSWRPLRCSYMCKNGGESFDWEDWFLWTL